MIALSMHPEIVTALRKRINEIIQSKMDSLANGHAEDFPEYRYRCGYIKAMHDMLGEIEETRKALMEG